MPLICEVNDATLDYKIEAIPRMETVSLDRVSLLKEIIERTAQIKQHYETMISRYGKLIGQGRIGLLELLDDLFIDIVLLNESLKQGTPERFAEFQKKREFRVLVENRNNKYYSTGIIRDSDVGLPNDFGKVYHELIVVRIKKILEFFKSAAAEGERGEGADEPYEIADALLYASIVIRYNILRCSIDK